MYYHELHCGRKQFCRYFSQTFSTKQILKHHIKNCFYDIICTDFESILVPEDNGKQNLKECYTNK